MSKLKVVPIEDGDVVPQKQLDILMRDAKPERPVACAILVLDSRGNLSYRWSGRLPELIGCTEMLKKALVDNLQNDVIQ